MEEQAKGILYIVATPIGNLEDITLRALRILREVSLIACEDTRVTKKLLSRYEIFKPVASVHQHSSQQRYNQVIFELERGRSVAYVTDAGTPGISDPGNKLVEQAILAGVRVEPIPGASALAALVSVAGIDLQKFVFLGFPPHKKGRETFFREVAEEKKPVIYYDSQYRFLKNLDLLRKFSPEKNIIVGRELTKKFEEVARGNIEEVFKYYSGQEKQKGEFVVIAY